MNKGRWIYIGKKLGQLILSLVVLSLIVFFVSRLAPGDPLRAYYGDSVERMSQEQLQAAEERLGLNDSLIVQYGTWVGNAIHGDFGISFQYKQPVTQVVGQVYGNTFALAGISFALIFALGLFLAVFCVLHEGRPVDRAICKVGVAANSIPEFFVALLLVLIFAVSLNWLPYSGVASVGSGGMGDRLIHLILPVAAIVISHLWYCAYLMRNRLSDEASKEYVLMCKVKGLTARQTVYKHCLKNIMPSVVSIMAIFLPHLLGGAYVVEMVFSYPGLGKLGMESAQYHDYNMLMIVCLITGLAVILANMAAQIINEKISPEIKEKRGAML
ncbi:MAG: ABC transporter permease [Clostridiales bacterium]|nr:ABC transporter permease [Clostridiales bacterium]